MRRILVAYAFLTLLLSGCKATGEKIVSEDLSRFWQGKTLLEEDIRLSEEQFADFAELAVAAPEEEALSALDTLFDRLKAEDEVAYYIYAGWMEGAFYHPLSPCRNLALFVHAVERISADGVLNEDERVPFERKRAWMQLNQVSTAAVPPEATDPERPTLALVLDLACPSCREALSRLAGEYEGYRHLAFCCGRGPVPELPGWEYVPLVQGREWFDLEMTPFYYLIDPSGVVTQSYTPAL